MGAHPAVDYDTELRLFDDVLRRSYDIRPADHVLDLGCGAGKTSRDAARLASAGGVLGVDLAPSMIERARHLAEAEGLRNVRFEQGDAAAYPFVDRAFDVAISRFGTMFFADPVAAFANIARAVRPDGRLVMMVWQSRVRNAWSVAIQRAITGGADVPTAGPDAFSLADPDTTRRLLEGAGFRDAAFADVDAPVYYGPDVDAAFAWASSFAGVSAIVKRDRGAHDRLRQALAEHARADGVWLGARAWIVTARRG